MSDNDVHTSGVVGDLIDAIGRGAVELEDRARRELDRLRDAYERARLRRALHLALFVGLAYLLFVRRKKR